LPCRAPKAHGFYIVYKKLINQNQMVQKNHTECQRQQKLSKKESNNKKLKGNEQNPLAIKKHKKECKNKQKRVK